MPQCNDYSEQKLYKEAHEILQAKEVINLIIAGNNKDSTTAIRKARDDKIRNVCVDSVVDKYILMNEYPLPNIVNIGHCLSIFKVFGEPKHFICEGKNS